MSIICVSPPEVHQDFFLNVHTNQTHIAQKCIHVDLGLFVSNFRCANRETIAMLKDGQEISIRRKLHRGHLVASASAGKFFVLDPFDSLCRRNQKGFSLHTC